MSMSDEVAGATLQVSMHAAEKAVDIAAKIANDIMDTIAKLLQALAAHRGGANGRERLIQVATCQRSSRRTTMDWELYWKHTIEKLLR